jgi:hypothetical protein
MSSIWPNQFKSSWLMLVRPPTGNRGRGALGKEQQQEAGDDGGNALTNVAQHPQSPVQQLILTHRPNDTQGNGDRPSQHNGAKGQQQGVGDALRQHFRDRTLIGKAFAKVKVHHHLPEPAQILHQNGLIKAELLL